MPEAVGEVVVNGDAGRRAGRTRSATSSSFADGVDADRRGIVENAMLPRLRRSPSAPPGGFDLETAPGRRHVAGRRRRCRHLGRRAGAERDRRARSGRARCWPTRRRTPRSRPSSATRPATDDAWLAVVVLVVVMALLEVVLLAGPAFAVIARRLQRSLALMAANGATPPQARKVVLASALVLGGAGAAVGVGLGLVVAWAALPVVQRFSDAYLGPYDVPWLHLLGIAGFGLLSALLAAVVPGLAGLAAGRGGGAGRPARRPQAVAALAAARCAAARRRRRPRGVRRRAARAGSTSSRSRRSSPCSA